MDKATQQILRKESHYRSGENTALVESDKRTLQSNVWLECIQTRIRDQLITAKKQNNLYLIYRQETQSQTNGILRINIQKYFSTLAMSEKHKLFEVLKNNKFYFNHYKLSAFNSTHSLDAILKTINK